MFGAENRGRTDTMFPSRDFKSLASAYSAIPACVLSFSSQPSARRSLCRRRDEYGSSVCLFRHSGLFIVNDIALRAAILLPMATVIFALCASDIALRAVKEDFDCLCAILATVYISSLPGDVSTAFHSAQHDNCSNGIAVMATAQTMSLRGATRVATWQYSGAKCALRLDSNACARNDI